MKKLMLCLSLITLSIIIAAPSFALPMATITGKGYSGTGGGEFIVDVSGVPGVSNGLHYTWCLERTEYISLRETYYATVSDAAMKGGVDTAGPTDDYPGGVDPDPNKDPLDPRTAWLYSKYLNGHYIIDDNDKAKDFQEAIWALEDEYTISGDGNIYYNAARDSEATSIGNIRVLNLWSHYDVKTSTFYGHRQDQLISVPDASIMYLLGTSLLGLGILGRKRSPS